MNEPRAAGSGLKLSTTLFLLLLLSGCLPLLLVLLVGFFPLRQQLRIWTLPSVERALDASLRANRGTFFSIRRALERRTRTEAAEIPLLLAAPDSVSLNRALDRILEREGVDLAQLWVERGDRLVCVASRAPSGNVAARGTLSSLAHDPLRVGPPPPVWVPLEGDGLSWVGVPAYLERPKQPTAALVLGVALGSDYFDRIDRVVEGLSYYRRLEELSRLIRTGYFVLFAVAAASALALSLLLARRIARGVSQPVEQLVSGMQALGRGQSVELVVTTRFPEILTLAAAFRAMSGTLRSYEEQLRESEQLKGARETARFVAHEIRNSLTPVQTSVSVLERRIAELGEPERDRARRALELIQNEAERMTRLASAFSEYAHLPAPAPESLELGKLLERLAESEVPDSIRLACSLAPDAPRINADRDEIERACRNLIKNAVEAMTPGGLLTLELTVRDDGAAIRVGDTGTGMDPDTLRQALQPGFTTKPSGTGLGLALVRRTVNRYGGRFRVESELGHGTTCEIWFPAERARSLRALGEAEPERGGRVLS